MFSSVEDVRTGLFITGYITDEVTTTVVYLAATLNKPILLEGPPGSGKTELAYAVAKATGAQIERLQCFEGINEEKAIGKFDESLQRLAVTCVLVQLKQSGKRLRTSYIAKSSLPPAPCSEPYSTSSDACCSSTN